MIPEHQQALAASVTSGISAAGSVWVLANEIAQFCAAVVAIVSGIAAAYYYLVKAPRK